MSRRRSADPCCAARTVIHSAPFDVLILLPVRRSRLSELHVVVEDQEVDIIDDVEVPLPRNLLDSRMATVFFRTIHCPQVSSSARSGTAYRWCAGVSIVQLDDLHIVLDVGAPRPWLTNTCFRLGHRCQGKSMPTKQLSRGEPATGRTTGRHSRYSPMRVPAPRRTADVDETSGPRTTT